MFKKASAIVLAICMLAAFTFTVSAEEERLTLRGWEFCGALLDAEAAGLVVGTAYTLVFEIESDATTGFRVRYSSGDGEDIGPFEHNDVDNSAHSSEAATASGTTANQVPALFPEGTISAGQTGTITVNFVFGQELPDISPASMRFIGLFGFQGGADFNCLGAALKDASGATLIGVGTLESAGGGGNAGGGNEGGGGGNEGGGGNVGGGTVAVESGDKEPDTGIASVATVIGIAAVASVGVFVSVKKRK